MLLAIAASENFPTQPAARYPLAPKRASDMATTPTQALQSAFSRLEPPGFSAPPPKGARLVKV